MNGFLSLKAGWNMTATVWGALPEGRPPRSQENQRHSKHPTDYFIQLDKQIELSEIALASKSHMLGKRTKSNKIMYIH